MLPILENLGLRVIAEEPFRIEAPMASAVWIHEFRCRRRRCRRPRSASAAQRASRRRCVAIWTGAVENDGFNRLVLAAGLSARQTTMLRLYCKVLRQAGVDLQPGLYGRHAGAPSGDRAPPRAAVRAPLRSRPRRRSRRSTRSAEVQAIDHALDAVESLDEDRILRSYPDAGPEDRCAPTITRRCRRASPKPYLAVKLASSEIDLLPLPRPLFEIYVYSPRVEGVHMRAGKVARGGIRWSDRKEDFRTEILGLMKAQTVKNAVIVPVGSKGGFVVKRPPAGARPSSRPKGSNATRS